MGHTWKGRLNVEKCVTRTKVCHSCKNVSHLEKWVIIAKMGQIETNKSKPGEIGHTYKNGSRLKKCVKLGKIGQTYKNAKMCHAWKNGSNLKSRSNVEKCVTLGKLGSNCKNRSHV